MHIVKVIAAVSLVVSGISFAQAQETSPPDNTVAQAQMSGTTVTHADKRRDSGAPSDYPSGFNTGPTKPIVKGCNGPVSFCNIYFGGS
ncbi:hypothetical protein [Paraburkholderia humisilvae]|uniref:Uncharacterized protein n=1 Tax=Paraburkholderia humisilvae TaxID=627669 RepID=A0A6J5ESP0_9BURK|nr:hypothetical protein [Paraburkholderia humisilvae]CAB3769608.1 hypothetical protein LMG29542_06157 [Paraburkholderia humisilvae]